ncbi:ADP-glyceromanno-heptose 6-epimerase [Hugenholtzia roseola]|uniref:ADP-glyceromanno-heptose 6-epimerase n=1 Tax=Hugenholtzia roseola TaxID=1002 RepID=UPI00041B626B|nr:ADP-glyceromanno-heptose 6-epimerase [Hugenholtzia roseola]
MILLTGAAGFIASAWAAHLKRSEPSLPLVLVDDFSKKEKQRNYAPLLPLPNVQKVEREVLFQWLEAENPPLTAILHIGARTDTTEFDVALFEKLNVVYSQNLWNWAVKKQIPFIYASSAATYGAGEQGYQDDESLIPKLKPLNPYGNSKQLFDLWVLSQSQTPPFWAGLKFFNVYGANEYHKGRMASVVFHAFQQIQKKGSMSLFRSHHPDFADGQQLRDFVYIKDVISVLDFLRQQQPKSGIYNLGSGKARSFLDLTKAVFAALDKEPKIDFIDTPIDIRDTYQYFTQATMQKIIAQGYNRPFHSLEEGVSDYVKAYLLANKGF